MADNFFFAQDNANKQDLLMAQKLPDVKRSVFPFGRSNIFKCNEGYILPADVIRVIPGDSGELDYVVNVSSNNPFVDRMFSGMQVYVHAFYQKDEHEWRGWKNFSTQGRRGNINLSLPVWSSLSTSYLLLNGYNLRNTAFSGSEPCQASFSLIGSLMSYMFGISYLRNNFVTNYTGSTFTLNGQTLTESSTVDDLAAYGLGYSSQYTRSFYCPTVDGTWSGGSWSPAQQNLVKRSNGYYLFNPIPLATYQRIYRDFYAPQNLFKDNPLWFPDDEEEFQLPYASANPVTCLSEKYPQYAGYSLVPNNNTTVLSGTPSGTTAYADGPILGALRCRQFEGDIFTTGLPFLERGGITQQWHTLIQALSASGSAFLDGQLTKESLTMISPTSSISNNNALRSNSGISAGQMAHVNHVDGAGPYQPYALDQFGFFETMNMKRELAVMTLWSERNARCDGSYNALIRAHYGVNPNSQDRSAVYLGGSRMRINFDNIVQQSESANTPLGQRVALANGSGMGSLGHFEFHDFGFIHIYISILPDTFYNQGIEPWFDGEQTGVDLPFPEFTSLPRAQVFKNRIFAFFDANRGVLFNYQERFLDYKYRMDRLSGGMLDVLDRTTRAQSFARYFTDYPEFNSEFVTASPYQLRDDMYASPKDFHWIVQFADSIRMVRELPWINEEANLANIA